MAAVPTTPPTPAAVAANDLYERYGRQIFAFCVHRLGSREEAEDAVQSTFLNAFRSLQRGVEPRVEAAWLFKIAENVCLTRLRSTSRRRRLESPTDLHALQDVVPSRSGESDELFNLPEALARMPQSQRRALLLREWHGLSYAEIATELELSQSAVETLLFRARRSLARGLEELPAPERRPRLRRVRAGELGSVFTVLKTLLFGGSVKVAASVVTVAATSVAVTPPARHELEHVVRDSARLAVVRPHPAVHERRAVPVRHPAAAKPASPAPVVVTPPVERPAPVVRRVQARVVHRAAPPKRPVSLPRHVVHAARVAPPVAAVLARPVVERPPAVEPAPVPPVQPVEQHAAKDEPAQPAVHEQRVAKHEQRRTEQVAPKATRVGKHSVEHAKAPRAGGAKHGSGREKDVTPATEVPVTPAPVDPQVAVAKGHGAKARKALNNGEKPLGDPTAAAGGHAEKTAGPHDRGGKHDEPAPPTEATTAPAEVVPAAMPPPEQPSGDAPPPATE